MEITKAIEEYEAALHDTFLLSEQEIVIKEKKIAAQKRLSMAKDELRGIESDILSNLARAPLQLQYEHSN